MIEFDADPSHTIRTTSYRMVELLSSVRITENLPTTEAKIGPAYWVAGRSDVTGSHILKAVVYNSTGHVPFDVTFEGVSAGAKGTLTYATAPLNASSTIGNDVVQMRKSSVTANKKGMFSFEMPMYSVGILEVDAESAGYGHPNSRSGWKGWQDWGHGGTWKGKNKWGQGWP